MLTRVAQNAIFGAWFGSWSIFETELNVSVHAQRTSKRCVRNRNIAVFSKAPGRSQRIGNSVAQMLGVS